MLGAVLLLMGGALYRLRLQALQRGELLTDEMIRAIEERGSIVVDEPLDYERIRMEEDRFWEEAAWDDPEE